MIIVAEGRLALMLGMYQKGSERPLKGGADKRWAGLINWAAALPCCYRSVQCIVIGWCAKSQL